MKNEMTFQPVEDGWFQIAPHGTFPHPSGALQVIDAEACEAMLGTFGEEARQANFPGLLVDFDHSSHDPAQPTTAAGWIGGLEHRGDGLYAQIRWSDLGHEALTGGRYRLASPVWNRADCDQWMAPAADGREAVHLRPRRLDRLALTNDPNLPGMMPLSNRKEILTELREADEINGRAEGLGGPDRISQRAKLPNWETTDGSVAGGVKGRQREMEFRGEQERSQVQLGNEKTGEPPQGTAAVTGGMEATGEIPMNLRNEVLQRLKLPGTATDGEIAETLRSHTAELETLRNRCRRLVEAQAESDLERFAEVITNRDVVRGQLMANRDGTLALLNALRPAAPPAPLHQPRLNRPNLALLSPLAGESDSGTARRVANRARQLQSQLKIGHHAAFRMAEGEAAETEVA